jgi:hypothetical protein
MVRQSIIKKEKMFLNTWDFLDEFCNYLQNDFTYKLEADEKQWGDTWLKRTRKGQEARLAHSMRDRIDKFENGGQPLDEESMLGDLFINWIRRRHPEIWKE